jgi:hypothetical protein
MSVFSSHHVVVSSSIKPFDDLETSQGNRKSSLSTTTNFEGLFDRHRQGLEIRTVEDVLKSNQPKLRTRGLIKTIDGFGKITHQQSLNNIGSVQSFVEYTNKHTYNDLQEELQGKEYIENNANVYYPYLMNSGLYKTERCTIEVLKQSDFRFPESSTTLGTTRGRLFFQGEFGTKTTCFLDEGEVFLGDSLNGAVVYEGWLKPDDTTRSFYYTETDSTNQYVDSLNITDSTMKNSLNAMTGSCLETKLILNINQTRTSLVFDGWRRGS